MADSIDDIRDGVSRVGMSDPMVQIGRGLGRIGETVEDGYRYVKDKIFPDRPADRPAAKRGDIRLPPDRKPSARQMRGR